MAKTIDRRQALTVIGTVSLGGILAACGDGDGKSAVTTADGTTTSVQSKTTSGVTAELFDQSASCSLTPEETEGPYYFDVDRIRSDIREDREGTLLRLALRVRDAESCKPIENAVVDIWHCDALGSYSGFESSGGGPPVLTTQLFFDEDVNTAAYLKAPYSQHTGREQFNDSDGIFDERLLLTTKEERSGFLGIMTFGVESA